MQRVAAYLLERRDGMEVCAARQGETARLRDQVLKWLSAKGGDATARFGTFKPEDDGTGSFTIDDAADGDQSWWMLKLEEATSQGRRFSTAASITASSNKIAVYVTLDTGWARSRIVPAADLDPKCPRIIRDLVALPGRWYHGMSTLRPLQHVNGFDEGEGLAAEIAHQDRSIPIVVVSVDRGHLVLPQLDEKLAHDLAGVANVVRADEDASWALTDVLGAPLSCYWGAVRLYWPRVNGNDRGFDPLWTAERLRSMGDEMTTRERFRKQLRGLVLPAAALSIVRPREVDVIRDAADSAATTALRAQATSLEEFKFLADNFAADADKYRAERNEARARVEELERQVSMQEMQVAKLEAERIGLKAHLTAKGEAQTGAIPPVPEAEQPSAAPAAGEVRFYKKVYAAKGHDVLVRVSDCGCNNWESAHAAPKASKGIAKLEGNRNDWKTLQHCASCTGGGMWKVRW